MKKKKTIPTIIVAIIFFLLIGVFVLYHHGISAVSSQDEEVIVQIEQGSSASQILDVLDEAGLVNNKLCGKIYLKLNYFTNLQANTYILNKNMSLPEIFSILENPDYENIINYKLTIKEGSTILDVAEAFADLLDVSNEEIIATWANQDYLESLIEKYWFIDESILDEDILYPLEGYLFPETYYISEEDMTVESITQLSLDKMDMMLSSYQEEIEKMGWTPHQFLTFASIVERESLFDEDRPIIAGVFINRLNTGMKLQSDVTVNYAWQKTGVKLTYNLLEIDSRYNTYKYNGLPVGPISTVSEATMEACIYYTEHDYLFFFADEEGNVYYSRTYDEHQAIVDEYKWY